MNKELMNEADKILVKSILSEIVRYSEKNGPEKALKFIYDNRDTIEKEFGVKWAKM